MRINSRDTATVDGEVLFDAALVLWSNGHYWVRADKVAALASAADAAPPPQIVAAQLYRAFTTPATGEMFCLIPRYPDLGQEKLDIWFAYGSEAEDAGPRERAKKDISTGRWKGARGDLRAIVLSDYRLLLWEDGRYSWAP